MEKDFLVFTDEVAEALKHHQAVVALESTIITHGMPYPDNLNTAKAVEQIIREEGAIPATIALHKGKIRIGLDEQSMEELAQNKDVIKASRRDLAFCLSQNRTASTTVAATMYCAHLAGLSIFVTGGIGGVHQQVTESFDISADLTELANTPITVICAGAKAILDLEKTLEMLETLGVAVIGYQCDEFPAFYSRKSGLALSQRLDTPEDIAKLIQTHQQLNLKNGIIIANPIPENAEIPFQAIQPIIQQAQKEAKNIKGKAITPFLLKRLSELTQGKSLKANIELIKNNALLGAKIAKSQENQINFKKNENNT